MNDQNRGDWSLLTKFLREKYPETVILFDDDIMKITKSIDKRGNNPEELPIDDHPIWSIKMRAKDAGYDVAKVGKRQKEFRCMRSEVAIVNRIEGKSDNNPRGIEIAKGIRGCSSCLMIPVVAICTGIGIGQKAGVWWGILGGVVACVAFSSIMSYLISKATKGLSVMDCLMPFCISIVCGIAFAPISIFAGSLFSFATCIYSGVLLSLVLFLYMNGHIGWGYLVLPFLTFAYEILPIELPTDLDNILALSGTSVNDLLALAERKKRKELMHE